jgi:hypothetical protein
VIRLAASAALLAALLGLFVVVAAFAVRSEASAALVLVVAVAGLVGLRATDSRRRATRAEPSGSR